MKFFTSLVAISLLLPLWASASFVITEIQYNPDGSDAGHEWLEVQNTGSTTQDLREYFFLESGVNHRIRSEKYGPIEPGGYAVIADKPENVDSSGSVFDSSFSLINSGEGLSIISPEGEAVDSVIYSPLSGGSGDGSTFSLINNEFVAGTPTPGSENIVFEPSTNPEEPTSESETSEESTLSTQKPSHIVLKQSDELAESIDLNIGGPRTLLAHVPYTFKTNAVTKQSYVWNFGDGTTSDSAISSKTFIYPGEYSLSLKTTGPKGQAAAQTSVTVIEPSFTLSSTSGTVLITNKTEYTSLIQDFKISHASSTFIFPEGSYIRPFSSVRIPEVILGFDINPEKNISLISPSGSTLAEFNVVLSLLEEQILETQERGSADENTEEDIHKKNAETFKEDEKQALPANPRTPFITPSIAEASESNEEDPWNLSSFDLVLLTATGVMALLYIGYTYQNKRKIVSEEFEDIEL